MTHTSEPTLYAELPGVRDPNLSLPYVVVFAHHDAAPSAAA